MSDWPAPRNREQWKAEVRDRWIHWLNDLPIGTTVLANNNTYWTRIEPAAQSMASASGWWMTGPNRVSTPVLLRMADDFVVVDVDNYPLDEPAPPPKVGSDRYSIEGEVEVAQQRRDWLVAGLITYSSVMTAVAVALAL
jgi:hypothetical protein